jgi:hypothetical protein
MDQLISRVVRALTKEREDIMVNTFNMPPTTLEGFQKAVGKYQGIGLALQHIHYEDQTDTAEQVGRDRAAAVERNGAR